MVHCQFKFQLAEPAASLALPGFNLNCKSTGSNRRSATLRAPRPVVTCTSRRLKFAAVARRGSARVGESESESPGHSGRRPGPGRRATVTPAGSLPVARSRSRRVPLSDLQAGFNLALAS
jgi:hypothetical protein